MIQFENFKNMNIESLAQWFDRYIEFGGSPWCQWFDDNYCRKCETVICRYPDGKHEFPCAWCEVKGKCKYFPDLDKTPNSQDIVKIWLESEVKD